MATRKQKKMDAVMEACQKLRRKLEDFFFDAAKWVRDAHGRRIKPGAVKAAVAKYRRRSITPDWVGKYLRYLQPALAV